MTKNETPLDMTPPDGDARNVSPNFITEIIERDLSSGRVSEVVTRFPPEPNGYLHVGHLKAIVLNFGVADDYRGRTNLRFDDTNPTTESDEYVEAIKRDVSWLGFEWDAAVHASDYFAQLYEHAVALIRAGKAYVDSLSEAEIREYRGTVTEAGRESPHRDRPAEESIALLEQMRRGEFPEGAHVLRAKIDMASRNMLMRDPLLYRIRHADHHRTGARWRIYPMYDFAHPLSDAIEGVSHSLCTLEFENNRELYDWVVENCLAGARPHQYEFARLNLEYTVLSKRRLIELVKSRHVSGWDDPRMPTIAGLRRRGVTPAALRDFINRVGVTKAGSRSDIALLEHSIRDDLNLSAPRVMAVLEPLKVVLSNYPEGGGEQLEAPYWPHDVPRDGSRKLRFGRELFVERADFSEQPPKGWRRLSPGSEVRLRHGYVIRCDEVIKDEQGAIVELICSYDPDTLDRNPAGRRVQGTIHWLDAASALPAQFRLYDRLFAAADPAAGDEDFSKHLNPDSLIVKHGLVEPDLGTGSSAGEPRYQFERLGYFWPDPVDSREDSPVFNRIVSLKDSWNRPQGAKGRPAAAGSGTFRERAAEGAAAAAASTARSGPSVSATPAASEAAGAPAGARPKDPVTELTSRQKTLYTQYRDVLGLDERDSVLIAANDELSRFFEAAVDRHDNPRAIANWIVNELQRELKGRELTELPLTAAALADLVKLVDSDVISARAGKEVLTRLVSEGGPVEQIVDDLGLRQVSDEQAIVPVIERLLAANQDKVRAYRQGKTGLSGFFVGQVMRETGGRANPQLVKELVERQLA